MIKYIKGKCAIHPAWVYGQRKRNSAGEHFWARGFYVSTVGRDETAVREYIRQQEEEGKRLDKVGLCSGSATDHVAASKWGRISVPA
ncbi:MAG: transposase [Acidobacteriia bacterium]|nr:transposase [Terriglobia bacterium]